jgi:hypothetical protein
MHSSNVHSIYSLKGCIVLNQLMYELDSIMSQSESAAEKQTISRCRSVYWLDGGHNGTTETWLTNAKVVENMKKHLPSLCHIHINVTPYQMKNTIKKRHEKAFEQNLIHNQLSYSRKLLFENDDHSIENHFRVIELFHNE